MIKFFIFYISRGYFLFKKKEEFIALFGGSFDPPHFGHKMVVKEAISRLSIQKVIIIPTFLSPFKSHSHFTPEQRLFMTKEMFQEFNWVFVSDFEIQEKKVTATATTVAHFQKSYEVKYLIIGADNLASIDKWYNFKWINEQITWVVARRAGHEVNCEKLKDFIILEVNVDISSTEIRNNITKENAQMSINEISVEERAERIVTFLDSKKAEELEVFNLEEIEYIAKRVVIANAISAKHAAALADQLKKELKPLGEEFLHIDESDDWVVVDLGDILIHIMTLDARQMYSMEEFLAELSAGKFSSPSII
jgi:nicotinate-nucleotide adenylyltransferase